MGDFTSRGGGEWLTLGKGRGGGDLSHDLNLYVGWGTLLQEEESDY